VINEIDLDSAMFSPTESPARICASLDDTPSGKVYPVAKAKKSKTKVVCVIEEDILDLPQPVVAEKR